MEREQNHPYAFVPVDYGLVDRTFIGMEPNWQEQYHNTPGITLVIQGEPSFFRGGCSYLELSTRSGNGHLYYGDHPNGLVHYYSHSGKEGRNEGGFGGTTFPTAIRGGDFRILRGPWSSRAACINLAVQENPEHMIMDVRVKTLDSRIHTAMGMKLSAIRCLAAVHGFEYSIVRERFAAASYHPVKDASYYANKPIAGEQGPYMPSISSERILKPEGMKQYWMEGKSSRPNFKELEVAFDPAKLDLDV